ncbi:KTSC domain-containing protein [Mucilaginibacter sp. SG538B]|uniref:KTSC domain-containing protein n=1 Tax=Mucilaginibacter sp. SG538B TaxID=2587021 RepID=UPI00159D0CC4
MDHLIGGENYRIFGKKGDRYNRQIEACLYKNVPESVYKELRSSRVKGRYLHFFVKNKYEFEQISTG